MEQDLISEKKEIVKYYLNKKILLSKDFLNQLEQKHIDELDSLLKKKTSEKFLFLIKDMANLLESTAFLDINWLELEKAKTISEKKKDDLFYNKFLEYLTKQEETKQKEDGVKVLFSYRTESKKRDVQDFVSYFNNRYKTIEKMLRTRPELQNLTSINRIINKKEKEQVSFICIIKEKQVTKNNNLILEVEDPTGQMTVLINKNKPELYEEAKDLVLDEIIGMTGMNGDKIVFVNNITWPDVPIKELKKAEEEGYAVFLSDFHVGSDNFLKDEFEKFLRWINMDYGTELHKEIAKKTKYIFIVGDLVDGCGIYPGQEDELIIKDIYEQYKECAGFLDKIPKHIKLIICPGNHDAMRIAEPQPELYKDFAEPIWRLRNAIMVSNPALVNIHSSENFPGFDVLMYHGYSFDYFVANVDNIRNQGGYDNAELIMKFLLKRRHLAPTHTSTLYIPDADFDPLVIEKIPDIFVTGHIHKASASTHKNITLICGSCWQKKTPFQEKVGHHPEPCRVPIVNLKTREIKILKF